MNSIQDWTLSIINDAQSNFRLELKSNGDYLLNAARHLLIKYSLNQTIDYVDLCKDIHMTDFHKTFMKSNNDFYFVI